MKKLKISTGGHRFYANDDLTHLNDAIQEAAAALAGVYDTTGACYLTNTSINQSGSNMVVQAGYMVYKGEICAFDAQSIAIVGGQTLAWVPVTSYRSCDPITYLDGSSKSPHEIKKVQLSYYAVAPADYVDASAVKRAAKADWTALTLSNGWTGTAYYRLNGDKIEFKGSLNASAATSSTFFQLPTGARPSRQVYGPIATTGAAFAPNVVKVDTTGDMSANSGDANWQDYGYWLDGLTFYLS